MQSDSDSDSDAAIAMGLDAWDGEGGASGAARGGTVASTRTTERWLLERLGAALLGEWNRLPMPLQRAIYNRAVAAGSLRNGFARRRRMARFLHERKCRAEPGDRS